MLAQSKWSPDDDTDKMTQAAARFGKEGGSRIFLLAVIGSACRYSRHQGSTTGYTGVVHLAQQLGVQS
jgi:hypothetical protein